MDLTVGLNFIPIDMGQQAVEGSHRLACLKS